MTKIIQNVIDEIKFSSTMIQTTQNKAYWIERFSEIPNHIHFMLECNIISINTYTLLKNHWVAEYKNCESEIKDY